MTYSEKKQLREVLDACPLRKPTDEQSKLMARELNVVRENVLVLRSNPS